MTEENMESVFKLRIVNVDYYLSEPIVGFDDNYSEFRETEVKKVPIIRIFGTTDRGAKTCLHIHGVYPYLSIPLDNSLCVQTSDANIKTYIRKLVNDLETNLMPSRVQTRNNKSNDSSSDQLIYNIEPFDAIPFYGYHKSCHKFLRIYFYNPLIVGKAKDQLLSGAIMDHMIQPFEAHIPYILQFFINNNLYGMNFIEVKKIRFRKTNERIDNLNYSNIEPISSCEVECDVSYKDIINRDIQSENKRNPGLEAIWAEEINRCHNSQELLIINGIPSQERSNIPVFESESYHFERLYQGLSSLNINFDDMNSSNSSQLSYTSDSKPFDFAEMIVQCIKDNHNSDDDDSDSSISREMSQRLSDVLTDSQKTRNNRQNRCKKNIDLRPTYESSSTEDEDSDSTIIDEQLETNEVTVQISNCVDAGTQTNALDSMDSLLGFVNSEDNNNDEEEIEEILCDCESDECCDQCCDQGSDQCECDCDKCEFEKCKRIPQFDGAFDDDSSDFSPDFKDISDDSDFELSSKKKSPKKVCRKRPQRAKQSTSAKKKSFSDLHSDSSDVEFTNISSSLSISRRVATNKKKLLSADIDETNRTVLSITSFEDKSDNYFDETSNPIKGSDKISSKLLSKFKSKDSTRKRRSTSPIHASFSEESDPEKESPLNFLSLSGFSYSAQTTSYNRTAKNPKRRLSGDRSDRSLTPYLSHESDDEIIPKTRPGPKSSKSLDLVPKPGPKSSKLKPGPKSSKAFNSRAAPKPNLGPKSSKGAKGSKPGPKSSKTRRSISSESELLSDSSLLRSRRNATKNINYDDDIEKISTTVSSIWSEVKPKTTPKSKAKTTLNKQSDFISHKKKSPIKGKTQSYVSDDCEPDLRWKSFDNSLVQIDFSYYNEEEIDSIGNEKLNVKQMPSYSTIDFVSKYMNNADYWLAEKTQISIDAKSGKKLTTRKKPLGQRYAQISKKSKAKPKTPKSKKVLSKRGSNSAKSAKSSNKKNASQTSRPKRGVTSSTLFTTTSFSYTTNTISHPFYESDIRVVTELTGYKKRTFLRSLCEDFELKVEKLGNKWIDKYEKQFTDSISPFLFNNIYYNDYSGYLSDEETQSAQDVIITLKNVIDNVVSVSNVMDTLVRDVEQELDPKPMIDTREEDYFEETNDINEESLWDYGHYADTDDDQYHELQEIGFPDRDNDNYVEPTIEAIPAFEEENNITNEESLKCDFQMDRNESNVKSGEDQQLDKSEEYVSNTYDYENNGCNGSDEDIKDNNDNNSEVENDSEIRNDANSDGERNVETDKVSEQVLNCESYNIGKQAASEEFSPSAHSGQYSNDNNEYNSPIYEKEDHCSQVEYEEEMDQSSSSSSSSIAQNNIPLNLSNIGITHVAMDPSSHEENFKMDATYNSEMFNYNVNHSQPFHQIGTVPIVPTAVMSPIMPTVISPQTHFTHQTPIYPHQQQQQQQQHQQNWSQSLPMNVIPINEMTYNMANVANNQSPMSSQQESEFDVNNYSYMPYYSSNPNIPQFDGIFDDDSFQSEGNQFNMNTKSENNIEHLSQGSRTEEMSITTSLGSPTVSSNWVSLKDNRVDVWLRSGYNDNNERYGKSINGVVVNIPKSIPDALLLKIGREVVALDRLKDSKTNDEQYVDVFTEDDSKSFLKTSLNGIEKITYLQSLCRDFNVIINRNHSYDSTLINYTNKEPQRPVSSFSNVISNKNKKLSVQNVSNCSLLSINNTSLDNEVPQNDYQLYDKTDDSNNSIYSFYLNETPSPTGSQSTLASMRSHDKSIDSLFNTSTNSDNRHSTPLNKTECKSISQILHKNDIQLSGFTQQTSQKGRKSFEKLKFENGMTSRDEPKQLYDSIIEGPTPSNTFDFEISSASALNNNTADDNYEYQYLTTMSVEVHVSTRNNLNPDPNFDNIEVIFYSISNDSPSESLKYTTGLIAVEPDLQAFSCADSQLITNKRRLLARSGYGPKDIQIDYANDEIVLLMKFVDIVKQWDPDIIVGYEIDTLSWGYVLQRANVLNMNVMTPLSRINDDKYSRNFESSANNVCHLSGRITLNLWHIMRHEVTLNVYTYENVHYHVLHERIPYYDYSTLTQWYSDSHLNRRRVMDHYVTRVRGSLRLLDKLDFITRNSELARLFGIQFSEVFNRGSQFRVESIMLRSTKQFNYIAVSPNARQVANMKAPESLPLILEPESKYYTDPVAVLDFQSLYPSMIIAYNYCYSTCLGKVDQLINSEDSFGFGCTNLEIKKHILLKNKDNIHISPNGVVFIKESVRRGILPKMLEEILETRIMVKNAIKMNNKNKNPNKALHRKLNARQLGLKLIANVTYGYTSANFSGRMPCVEIADAIVSKGRETLERAIGLIQSEPKWGGKVIYGDTDSIFVLFSGCSKEEAFKRGQEIAEAVTAINPKPVKLKFEKVYLPCVLQTKKRYVGFMYESLEQTLPVFDAKGIETVRRDTCPAVHKLLEKSLKILFSTNDTNGVKMYLLRQFQKILEGRVSIINDFIFAREYRGKENYSNKTHVPSMEIARKRLAVDIRSEPKIDERVPYVIVYGPPNQSLFKLVKEPLDLIRDPSLRLNAVYYIERVIIPALNRVFQLMGYDVMKWYNDMPRKTTYSRYQYLLGQESKARTIPQFFNTAQCPVCGDNCKGKELCDNCSKAPQESVITINDQIRELHKKYSAILQVCRSCNGSYDNKHDCVSIDCPNLFRFHQSKFDYMNVKYLNHILTKF